MDSGHQRGGDASEAKRCGLALLRRCWRIMQFVADEAVCR